VNLTGQFLTCKAAIPHILKTKGAIVNTASVAGLKSHPYSAAYCASKGGVVQLTRALAVEYGPKGIRVNVIAPGMTQTDMISSLPDKVKMLTKMQTPLRRLGDPQDVANAAEFLVSSRARHITGETIRVGGGITMS